MKYQVKFRLQPTSAWKNVKHLFESENAADDYAEAIIITAPPMFNPEVEIEEICDHENQAEKYCNDCGKMLGPIVSFEGVEA
jgi:hypothetical protein